MKILRQFTARAGVCGGRGANCISQRPVPGEIIGKMSPRPSAIPRVRQRHRLPREQERRARRFLLCNCIIKRPFLAQSAFAAPSLPQLFRASDLQNCRIGPARYVVCYMPRRVESFALQLPRSPVIATYGAPPRSSSERTFFPVQLRRGYGFFRLMKMKILRGMFSSIKLRDALKSRWYAY